MDIDTAADEAHLQYPLDMDEKGAILICGSSESEDSDSSDESDDDDKNESALAAAAASSSSSSSSSKRPSGSGIMTYFSPQTSSSSSDSTTPAASAPSGQTVKEYATGNRATFGDAVPQWLHLKIQTLGDARMTTETYYFIGNVELLFVVTGGDAFCTLCNQQINIADNRLQKMYQHLDGKKHGKVSSGQSFLLALLIFCNGLNRRYNLEGQSCIAQLAGSPRVLQPP